VEPGEGSFSRIAVVPAAVLALGSASDPLPSAPCLVAGPNPLNPLNPRTDLRDDQGRSVASGVYIVRLSGGKVQLTQRLLLVR
jgi:hypothetical protein